MRLDHISNAGNRILEDANVISEKVIFQDLKSFYRIDLLLKEK